MTGNVVTKKYMSDNEKFADVFNYVLYDGCSVIRPEELTDCDANELFLVENANGKVVSKDKKRLRELMAENEEYFCDVPYDTAMLIKYCANIDVRVKKDKEGTNMCKAIEDMITDAREEVRQEYKNIFCAVVGLYNEKLISLDEMLELIILPTEQLQNAIKEIRLKNNSVIA